MEIRKIKIDDIIPYSGNAKLHPEAQIEQIKESIRQFGNNDPIAIDESNVIIEGHGRWIALKELGFEDVDCIVLEGLTEEEKNAYRIVHNQLTMNTGWDMETLKRELENLPFDMTALGLSEDMLDEIEGEHKEIEEDDFDIDEALDEIEEPKTKKGDLYKLGDHYLLCGDSTSEEDVEKLMQGRKADLLLTDPPYNVDYTGGTEDALKIENDNMEDAEFREFLRKAFLCADNSMNEGASFYIWHADSEGYNFRGACHDIGWQVRQCLIWAKNSMVMGRQDYQWKHEPCLYGWKGGASHRWFSDRTQTTLLNFDRPTKNDLHPTMKPLDLFGYLVQNSSRKGEAVLDLFGGSGTTLIVCEKTDRKCFMMELDPKYCDVIVKRWETLTGGKAELVNG